MIPPYVTLASERCVLRALFKSPAKVAENQWTLVGNPPLIPGGGISLDGATQYIHRPIVHEFNGTELTFAIRFTPDFPPDSPRHYFWWSQADANRYACYKYDGVDVLVLYVAGVPIFSIAKSVYSPYWKQGEENTLVWSVKSGANWGRLNGNLIGSNATAWSPKLVNKLHLGAYHTGAYKLDGIIHSFEIFQEAWDATQEAAFRNNSTFAALGQSNCSLPMRSQILAPDTKNILVDGDMELPDTSAWIAGMGTLSKETGSPHGGLRVLRIAEVGGWTFTSQSILTAGRQYCVQGFARSGGVLQPVVIIGGGGNPADWTGTISTAWQEFNVTGVADGNAIYIGAMAGSGYVEFDDMSVHDMTDLQQTPDRSGSGRDFLLGGDGVTAAKFPTFMNLGFEFDGANDYMRYNGSLFNNAEQTIAICFAPYDKVTALTYWQFLDSEGANEYYARVYAGKLQVSAGGTVLFNILQVNWIDYLRYHEKNVIVISGTSGATSLWLNAKKWTTATVWTPGDPSYTHLGIAADGAARPFKGMMYNVRLFDFVISDTQVRELQHRWTTGAA